MWNIPAFRYTSVPIRKNGSIAGTVVVFRDISERKEAEQALRESRATARGLLDATQESLLLLDKEGIIIAVNQTAARRGHRKNSLEPTGLISCRKICVNQEESILTASCKPVIRQILKMFGTEWFYTIFIIRFRIKPALSSEWPSLPRKLPMIQLKEEINELLGQLDQGEKYEIVK
jgi:transcriptional regulator with PAS, ATPase and Fis domain